MPNRASIYSSSAWETSSFSTVTFKALSVTVSATGPSCRFLWVLTEGVFSYSAGKWNKFNFSDFENPYQRIRLQLARFYRLKSQHTFSHRAISTKSIPTSLGRRPSISLHIFKIHSKRRFLQEKVKIASRESETKYDLFIQQHGNKKRTKSFIIYRSHQITCHQHCA